MEPIHVLVLDTVMDRGGAEAMIMNYMRNVNREIIQFDFLTNREYRAAYEEEIESLGGKVSRSGDYPAWEYVEDSKLRILMGDTYREMYKKEPG